MRDRAIPGQVGPVAFPSPRRRFVLQARDESLLLGARTMVMGVLNCTPDSFSDGGAYLSGPQAIRRLRQMEEEGADLIDVGGESSRPGAEPVDAEEEWKRIAPVFREVIRGCGPLVSVDTTKAEVARRALDHGAVVINDISGLRFDPGLGDLAARSGAALILMHMQGEPRTMQNDPTYLDVVDEVAGFLGNAAGEAERRGVSTRAAQPPPREDAPDGEDERDQPPFPTRLVLDPGIGFGKTGRHNLELLRRLPELATLGRPLLIGASRKRFLGDLLGLPVDQRVEASVAVHTVAALAGAHIVRAHDVRATVRAVRIADAVMGGWLPDRFR